MSLALAIGLGIGPLWKGLPAQSVPVLAKSAILIEADTGAVLYAKAAEQKRFPASTTKIMTAMLVLEQCRPEEMVIAPQDITKIKESSAHLKPGEKMSVRQTLFAILLRSANDASVAAAIHVDGTVQAFAARMTQKAKELGCLGTNFTSPNGLHDPNHFTTAEDLAIISRAAMKNPAFRQIVATAKHELTRSVNQRDRALVSRNKLLGVVEGLDGIKTGYTKPAGHCFVGSAVRNGMRLISVVLSSEDWEGDTQALLDWGYENTGWKELCTEGKSLGKEEIPGLGVYTELIPAETVRFPTNTLAPVDLQMEWKKDLKLPLEPGTEVATIQYSYRRGDDESVAWHKTVSLKTAERLEPPPTGFTMAGFAALGLALFGGYAMVRHRRNHQNAELLQQAGPRTTP